MLITSAQNEMLAARAGFLLAEIDYLSAKCLPVSPTRGHSSLSEATGEIITAHFMKIINEESSLQENSECATRRAHQGSFKEINHLPAPYFVFENSRNFQRAIFVF